MPSFPLVPPVSPSASDLKLTPNNIVGENESPFTYSQQIFEYPGDRWEAELALPAMSRAQAEPWLAFLSALRGKAGTFLLGDPNGAPQGSAARSNVNLLAWSEDFSNSVWNGGAGLSSEITGATTAPDGNTTGNRLVEDSSTSAHFRRYVIAGLTPTAQYTYSIYLKSSGTRNFAVLSMTDNVATTICTCSVNLTTGAVSGSGSPTSQNVGNGWFRYTLTCAAPATGVYGLDVDVSNALGVVSYTGDGSSGLYCWGAQLESGTVGSAYIGTSFGFNAHSQISMNGTTQGPKFILLKGLAPNSVAFKAGDYIECGYGLNATRITTSGGTSTRKIFFDSGIDPSLAAQTYVLSVRLRNLGAKTVNVTDNIISSTVASGIDAQVLLQGLGNGATNFQMTFDALASGDVLDFIAWSPRLQRLGLDENLIPVANQNFTGFGIVSGAAYSLVQGYNRRLYKVTADATSDAKGNCGVEIFPRWRNGDAVADGDPVNVFSPKGLFRLQDNPRTWQIGSDLLTQGVTLKCKEAL